MAWKHYLQVGSCRLWLAVPQEIRELFDFITPPPLAPYRDVVQSIQGQ
jgi:hypothetical protein